MKHYRVLTLEDIQAFPLPEMAEDSVLMLWRVASMQQEALDVIDAWGFKHKTEIVWDKRLLCRDCGGLGSTLGPPLNGDVMVRLAEECERCGGEGDVPWFGMGWQVRGGHETCLIATRGRNIRQDASVSSVFRARGGRHSEKPGEFYDIVERLYPGPYHELFARRSRDGWTCEGDEIDDQG